MKNIQNQEIRLILSFLAEIVKDFFQVELIPINSKDILKDRKLKKSQIKKGKTSRMRKNKS